jgi:hypothetical protein
MIHYVYINGQIYLQDISLFDFGSKYFSKGRFFRVKSLYKPFNWDKHVQYISHIKKISKDHLELTFTDPIFTHIDQVYTIVRGYVNYDYDEEDDVDNIDNFTSDMSPIGWYVQTKQDEYIPILSIDRL